MRRRELVLGLVAGSVMANLAKAAGAGQEALTGGLANWKSLPGTKGFEPAFEYLAALDPGAVTPGRTPIVGDEVYAAASKYATKALETARFEAHKKYIDIQCILSGQEIIGFVPTIEGLTVLEPHNVEKDVAFYAIPTSYASLSMNAGRFAIFYPGQGHMPNLHREGPHDVVKVVVKVNAAWYAARPR